MFKVEVIADSSGKWCGNALTFPTKPEAEDYARNLALRWTLVREWRIVETDKTALFNPGRVVVTAALHHEIQEQGLEPVALVPYLDRHVTGDWGEIDPHDRRVNADALKTGARILSAYDMPSVGRIWIITDAAWTDDVRKREVTTVLFPSDY